MRRRLAALPLVVISSCFTPDPHEDSGGTSSTDAASDSSTGTPGSTSTTGTGTTGTTATSSGSSSNSSSTTGSDDTADTAADDSTGAEPLSCATATPPDGMTCIPGGPFLMGSLPGQGLPDDEQPQHTVTLSPYFIDTTEVTVAAYAMCVNEAGCAPPTDQSANWGVPGRMNHPVDGVFFGDAQAYCAWADKELPTEAQWERAARGARGATFPWGEAPLSCDYAHVYEGPDIGCGTGATAEVGFYPLGNTDEGVSDMAGNVTEWVADWYSASYYSSSPEQDPLGPKTGTLRVYRGGSAQTGPANGQTDQVRTAFRGTRPANDSGTHLGFRCVRPLE